jgi:hypothetical protein
MQGSAKHATVGFVHGVEGRGRMGLTAGPPGPGQVNGGNVKSTEDNRRLDPLLHTASQPPQRFITERQVVPTMHKVKAHGLTSQLEATPEHPGSVGLVGMFGPVGSVGSCHLGSRLIRGVASPATCRFLAPVSKQTWQCTVNTQSSGLVSRLASMPRWTHPQGLWHHSQALAMS